MLVLFTRTTAALNLAAFLTAFLGLVLDVNWLALGALAVATAVTVWAALQARRRPELVANALRERP